MRASRFSHSSMSSRTNSLTGSMKATWPVQPGEVEMMSAPPSVTSLMSLE